MSGPFAFVVTDEDDDHGAAVLTELHRRGADAIRLNVSDVRRVPLRMREGALGVLLAEEWRPIPVRPTVWWRRAGVADVTGLGDDEAALVRDEAPHALIGALAAADARFVDNPFDIERAELKLVQLMTADSFGISTPTSLVTNDVATAREFSEGRRIVTKALSPGVGIAPFTAEVSREDLGTVETSPTLLQELVSATADVRVVVVGSEAWAWRRAREGTTVDWRSVDPSGFGFELFQDKELCRRAIQLTAALRLSMSAQDWLEGPEGSVFLEANPQGAWAFLPGSRNLVVPALASHLLGQHYETAGEWPRAIKRFLYDFLPKNAAPENDGVVAPSLSTPLWVDEVAARPGALEAARRAHDEARVSAKTAEEKATRLTQASLALLTIGLAVGGFQLDLVLRRELLWLLALVPISTALVCLALAAFESLEIDRVGTYAFAQARDLVGIGSRDPSAALLEAEELGRQLARWTSVKKHSDLMQARAWFTRGLAALVAAALLALVARTVVEVPRSSTQTPASSVESEGSLAPSPLIRSGPAGDSALLDEAGVGETKVLPEILAAPTDVLAQPGAVGRCHRAMRECAGGIER